MTATDAIGKTAALTTAAMISALVLSGCTGAATPPPTRPPAATATPTTAETTPAPVRTSYNAARVQWLTGATAVSADQGRYWSAAMTDLVNGETTDTDPTGYANAAAALKSLIALPDAQQSPAQNAEYHADIDSLNAFFTTPNLYS